MYGRRRAVVKQQILNSTDFTKNNLHRQRYVQSRMKRLA